MDEDHYLQLCYFHFCQSMRRYFQKNQKSQILSDLNSIANLLPFISEQEVVNVIQDLYKYDVTKKFAKYFEDNYLNKYSFDDRSDTQSHERRPSRITWPIAIITFWQNALVHNQVFKSLRQH